MVHLLKKFDSNKRRNPNATLGNYFFSVHFSDTPKREFLAGDWWTLCHVKGHSGRGVVYFMAEDIELLL